MHDPGGWNPKWARARCRIAILNLKGALSSQTANEKPSSNM